MTTRTAAGKPAFTIQSEWDMEALYGKQGGSMLRGFYDINDDGVRELICNIGAQADFVALDTDGSEIWRNTQSTSDVKPAYYPKFVDGDTAAIFGDRNSSFVHCIDISDGSQRWKYQANGDLEATEAADFGAVVGSSGTDGEVVVVDYADGSVLTGWPVSFKQHEQCLGAGDLDGDGTDEVVMNDNSGNIEVRNSDGSLRFSKSSSHTHVDLHIIGPINPNQDGNVLLTVVNDDGSGSGEGDEIIQYDKDGTEIAKFAVSNNGPVLATADLKPEQDGYEIAYGLEGQGVVGLLDGTLSQLWEVTMASELVGSGASGQIAVADIDGDGRVEIVVATGQSSSEGFFVYDDAGNYVGRLYGHGWDTDPIKMKQNAAVDSKRFVDIDGDGRDEIHPTLVGADTFDEYETIRLIERLA